MNYVHLHLLLNHFPIIGMFVGFGLFLLSFVGKNNKDMRRAAYIVFVGIALITIPAFMTGFAAQSMVKGPGYPDVLIQRHESSALLSIWFMLATGVVAIVGLWQSQYKGAPSSANVALLLVVSALTTGLIARTGFTAGEIRHPEIRTTAHEVNGQITVNEGPIGALVSHFEPDPAVFADKMTFSKWWWTAMMASHFIGLILIVGTVGLLDIRIMGFMKQLPIAPIHRLLPWGLFGLGMNIATGLAAFASRPDNYVYSAAIWVKMLALLLLGLNAVAFYLTDIFGNIENLKPGEDAPITAKLVAASGLFLWFVVIAMGRYIQPLTDTLLGSN